MNDAARRNNKNDHLANHVSHTGGSVWLKHWAEVNDKAGGNPDVVRFILIYFAFGIGAAFLVVLQTLILWIFCSIEVCCILSLCFPFRLRA